MHLLVHLCGEVLSLKARSFVAVSIQQRQPWLSEQAASTGTKRGFSRSSEQKGAEPWHKQVVSALPLLCPFASTSCPSCCRNTALWKPEGNQIFLLYFNSLLRYSLTLMLSSC